ncbi:MAG: glycosyltransferase [Pseudonocardia sp.]|nr:glycosyltransferase [Pseudonocardia sp.]
MGPAGPPRILHVAQPTAGGVAGYLAAAARDQARRGWRVSVAAPSGGELEALLAGSGVDRRDWPAGRSPDRAVVSESLRLRRIVRAVRPEIIHLHSAKAGLAGRLAVRGALPTLFQPHGWSWLAVTGPTAAMARRWERRAVRWTDLCVCVGEGERAHAEAAGIGGTLTVVRNGVDLARFARAGAAERRSARATLGVAGDVPLVVCPGRITRQKGQDVLLEAWPRVRASVPRAELALVGGGDPAVGAGSAVHRPGAVRDVRPWLAAADVVVFPSRWEGLSLGLLEAMAVGRSTVVSAVPGLAELVEGPVGAAVPAGAPVPLADAVVARLLDPARAGAEGAAAASRARPDFGSGVTLDRLAAVTLQVRQRRHGPAVCSAGPAEQLSDDTG